MNKLFPLIIMIICGYSVSAQTPLPDSLKSKYHMLTWEEFYERNEEKSRSITPTPPPPGNVRSIAEWEPNQGVIVAYPSGGFGIPVSLIKQLADIVNVRIVYDAASALSTIQNELVNGNVDTSNVDLHNVAVNSYWTRDFSPWFISYRDTSVNPNHDIVGVVNFDYNRPRPDDNNLPVVMGNIFGVDVFGMEVEHTGGNYMSDGMGKAASTTLVYDENASYWSYNIDSTTVDQRMNDYLGINDYIVVDDPMGDYIEHIDCWGKFLDVDKVLIGEVPQTNSQYSDYEAVADYFANHPSSYGTNYEVYRVYSPDGQPYTNSLIMNGHVFVPVVTGTGSQWNDDAINVYENAMPGYQIHEVPNTTAPSWASTDALHCRTHEIADLEMLHISHVPVNDTAMPVIFNATIESYAGNLLANDSVGVYYSINNSSWQFVQMTPVAGNPNQYQAAMPALTSQLRATDTIRYYIHAEDMQGKEANHPYIGNKDPHIFTLNSTEKEEYNFDKSKISLFPNPARNKINIALHHFENEDVEILVSDLNGRIKKNIKLQNIDDWTLLELNIEEFPAGTYVIRVKGEINTATQRFSKI